MARKTLQVDRRLTMTLLEVLIAFVLLASLMAILLNTYYTINVIHKKTADEEKISLQYLHLQSRLSNFFTFSLPPPNKTKEENAFYFFTSKEEKGAKEGSISLIFLYDNHAAVPPIFSNAQLAKLFLDSRNRLCIASWPSPLLGQSSRQKMHKEILLEGVRSIRFQFYNPPQREDERLQAGVDKKGSWLSTWPPPKFNKTGEEKHFDIPAMIKITLLFENPNEKEKVFAFIIPKTKNHIFYQ